MNKFSRVRETDYKQYPDFLSVSFDDTEVIWQADIPYYTLKLQKQWPNPKDTLWLYRTQELQNMCSYCTGRNIYRKHLIFPTLSHYSSEERRSPQYKSLKHPYINITQIIWFILPPKIYIINLATGTQHWSRWWLGADRATSHHLSQCCPGPMSP